MFPEKPFPAHVGRVFFWEAGRLQGLDVHQCLERPGFTPLCTLASCNIYIWPIPKVAGGGAKRSLHYKGEPSKSEDSYTNEDTDISCISDLPHNTASKCQWHLYVTIPNANDPTQRMYWCYQSYYQFLLYIASQHIASHWPVHKRSNLSHDSQEQKNTTPRHLAQGTLQRKCWRLYGRRPKLTASPGTAPTPLQPSGFTV